ncbi:endonuclease/exonuclease/phosphatase family protein [Marihabitans asiaticum]|uniref:Endonuclease/exonuclease/phosphatase family metal-dependent hydrolase n=1 Tax=Marihabitans asiaticum TaxID=415218 RepID=A0A560W6Y3_9MICO|nr:endonuclease/exonuclease/phosphatase family protein [Marihabitans asiaticum]TWD13374.1 endonuclease/exonuclease/phosphatase family metal-dependent hydrolase [Marihabitans asiaticum]
MTLRVATYNIRALQDDVSALVRVIRAIDPDVLCLQEVPWIPPVSSRVTDLARRCGLVWSGRSQRSGQTSVLTNLRTNVLSVSHHHLPAAARWDQRGFAVTRVAPFGHAHVSVASVHLSLDTDERVRHTRSILARLEELPGPALLAGDLNEQSDGRAWQLISARMQPVSPLEPTFPARHPDRVLDVVFATDDITVLPQRGARLDPDDLVAASDHLPVWVDIDLPEVPGTTSASAGSGE